VWFLNPRVQALRNLLDGWTRTLLVGWLDTHPFAAVVDIQYLTKTASKRKALATQIVHQQDIAADDGKKNWTGKYPYLCLFHCLVDNNNTKRVYIWRNNIQTGWLYLDTHNSADKRDAIVWEMMADTFNNQTFAPETEAVVDTTEHLLLRLKQLWISTLITWKPRSLYIRM
jgi:hypothetical protein